MAKVRGKKVIDLRVLVDSPDCVVTRAAAGFWQLGMETVMYTWILVVMTCSRMNLLKKESDRATAGVCCRV